MTLLRCGVLSLALAGLAAAQPAVPQLILFKTNLGEIEAQLLPGNAPATVANFLNYMNKNAYDGTIFHRSVRGFIIQSGGFKWTGSSVAEIPQDPPVRNEYGLSNSRGTIAMAKLGDNPDSATNQFFFNLGDNSANLNNQNGGFTVFARVTNAAGLAVMDRLAAVPVPSPGPLPSPFDQIPLQNYSGGDVKGENLLIIESIRAIERPSQPIIRSESGAIQAGAFGGGTVAAPGSFIEIYGSSFSSAEVARSWDVSKDFVNGRAPTTLESVGATINGQPTFISYVSPTQLNVQIPANVPTGEPLDVRVTHRGVTSDPVRITVRDQAGGLLAPASFRVGDRQYVAALRPNGSFVTNGNIAGLPAAPAVPGETLLFYGTGFGLITGTTKSLGGDIAEGLSRVLAPVQFRFGNAVAQVTYAGLTPGLVGLYQFNVVVPADTPTGDVELTVTQAGTPIAQKLTIPVRAAGN